MGDGDKISNYLELYLVFGGGYRWRWSPGGKRKKYKKRQLKIFDSMVIIDFFVGEGVGPELSNDKFVID